MDKLNKMNMKNISIKFYYDYMNELCYLKEININIQ